MPNLNQNTTDLQSLLESVNALPKKVDTSGTATASDIFTGKTATVNDTLLTGTNPYNAANVDPAVTSALNALVEKGVDTSGKGLADLGSLIAAIEAGGGEFKYATGSITPSEDIKSITITHNLGRIPDFFLFFGNNIQFKLTASYDKGVQSLIGINNKYLTFSYMWRLASASDTRGCTNVQEGIDFAASANAKALSEATEQTILVNFSNWSAKMFSGNEYIWIAG